jgi:chaperone modulatory protein CbpM
MSEREVLVAIALDEACLTLEQLAEACAVEPEWVVRLVEEGCFAPMEGPARSWRFGAAALNRARRIRRIERDFDAVPELAALVADMLEEIDRLRRRPY